MASLVKVPYLVLIVSLKSWRHIRHERCRRNWPRCLGVSVKQAMTKIEQERDMRNQIQQRNLGSADSVRTFDLGHGKIIEMKAPGSLFEYVVCGGLESIQSILEASPNGRQLCYESLKMRRVAIRCQMDIMKS